MQLGEHVACIFKTCREIICCSGYFG